MIWPVITWVVNLLYRSNKVWNKLEASILNKKMDSDVRMEYILAILSNMFENTKCTERIPKWVLVTRYI